MNIVKEVKSQLWSIENDEEVRILVSEGKDIYNYHVIRGDE